MFQSKAQCHPTLRDRVIPGHKYQKHRRLLSRLASWLSVIEMLGMLPFQALPTLKSGVALVSFYHAPGPTFEDLAESLCCAKPKAVTSVSAVPKSGVLPRALPNILDR